MLYQGQTHTVAVPVTPAMVQGNEPQLRSEQTFAKAYTATYGTNLKASLRVVNLKVSVCRCPPSI